MVPELRIPADAAEVDISFCELRDRRDATPGQETNPPENMFAGRRMPMTAFCLRRPISGCSIVAPR